MQHQNSDQKAGTRTGRWRTKINAKSKNTITAKLSDTLP